MKAWCPSTPDDQALVRAGCGVDRVTGRRRDADRDAGEGGPRGEVEVAADDGTYVASVDDLGEQVLVVQLDHLGRAQHRHRDRRVVQRQDRAVLGRLAQHVGQPGQLLGRQLAVVVARHARVQRHDAQAADVVHRVLRGVALGAEQLAAVVGSLVVVAHRPDHPGADRLGGGLDDAAQGPVRLRLALVGQVAGEDERLRGRVDEREALDGLAQALRAVDGVVLLRLARKQVRVADVGDREPRSRVLAELHGLGHGVTVGRVGSSAHRNRAESARLLTGIRSSRLVCSPKSARVGSSALPKSAYDSGEGNSGHAHRPAERD